MKKYTLAGVGLAIAALSVWALTVTNKPATTQLRISASFYPMAEFARQVAGSRASVRTLVQPGVEPHDFEPTAKDVAGLYHADLVVYNGAGLEPWLTRLAPDLQKHGVTMLEASYGLATHNDPHVWLDPVFAKQQVAAIAKALTAVDPAGQQQYQTNAQAYSKQLEELDNDYRRGLANCEQRQIVTSHQAFAYLAKRYDLTVLALSGLSPDDEPSPQTLAQAAQFANAHHITHVFFETLASPKLSQTIAKEIGATTLVFNPLEGLTKQQADAGQNYLSIQKDNLQALRTALHCK